MFNLLRSTKRKDSPDDNQVDVYLSGRSFELSGGLFELLEVLASYDETESYDVCVLQFTQEIPVLHWSIYLQSQSVEGGPVYDVWYYPENGRWERKESQANQVTHRSSVWHGGKSSGGYCGGTVLGTIDSLHQFQSIIRSTPLPGNNENCQNWVENVIRRAVNQGLLYSGALQKLRGIPRR